MGIVQVTATVRNPAEPSRSWDGLFLVDTGSTDCVVPADALRGIGLVPKGRRTYELADGREETVDVTGADIEFMGDYVGTTVCFGPEEGIEPILGLTALESVGIEVDPVEQRLKRRPSVRMKRRSRPRAAA
ncbi:MAG: clan AA aspartic protease [Gammaproteobacteria bacterium]|nr:clan AA aspartic protease [Gammaproteobacteria bacterium]